jgi:oligopeptide transport system substrate-binding protein
MKLKKNITSFLIIIMCLILAVGCSPPTTQDTGGESTEDEAAETPDETSKNEYLVWNLGDEPGSWDPQLAGTIIGGHLINNLFEGLMIDTKDGLEYGVAESYEIAANDQGVEDTVYTFKLREDAKWSDGKPLTAHDFEYSLKRLCDPETASSYAFLITDYVVGADEFFNGEGERDDVKVNALDDHTLSIEIKQPTPYFLNLVAFSSYMPSREDMVKTLEEGWEKDPKTCISNGPFKLTEYKIGSHMMLEKNENYWDASNVELPGIKVLMLKEGSTALQGYQAGDIQVLDNIPKEDIPKLMAEDPNFTSEPGMGTMFYSFNVDVEPVNDVNVRKALSLAIDRKMIVEQVLRSGEEPATGYVPAGFSLSDGSSFRELDEYGRVVPEHGIDPWNVQIEEAKEYLEKAGYPNGEGFPEIELLYNVNENDKKIAEAVQEMWKKNLGINVKLRNEEWSVFTSTRYQGEFTVCRGGWGGDYNDPMTMFDLFTSYGINYSQWRWQPFADRESDTILNPANKDYEDALKAAMSTTGKERDEHLKRAEKILMDDAIMAPLYYYANTYIIDGAKVEGIERGPMGYWLMKNAKLVN